jgi:hypothetical protein
MGVKNTSCFEGRRYILQVGEAKVNHENILRKKDGVRE